MVFGPQTVHLGQNSWDAVKIHLRKLGSAGKRLLKRAMRDARGEGGRWPRPLWAYWGRQAGLEKCSHSPYKWHPKRLVSSRTTLIPLLGLYSDSLTPTYTVNGKVTFEKWGPHRDLIHWVTPGRGAFPPRRLCDLDWDYTSVWIVPLSPSSLSHRHTLTHTDKFLFSFISGWSRLCPGRSVCSIYSWPNEQTWPWFPYARGARHFYASH